MFEKLIDFFMAAILAVIGIAAIGRMVIWCWRDWRDLWTRKDEQERPED